MRTTISLDISIVLDIYFAIFDCVFYYKTQYATMTVCCPVVVLPAAMFAAESPPKGEQEVMREAY